MHTLCGHDLEFVTSESLVQALCHIHTKVVSINVERLANQRLHQRNEVSDWHRLFYVDCLQNPKQRLEIKNVDQEYRLYFIHRDKDKCPDSSLKITFELSFIATDDSTISSERHQKHFNHEHFFEYTLPSDDVFRSKRAEILSNDTLSRRRRLLITIWIFFRCGQLIYRMADCEVGDATRYCNPPVAFPSRWLRREAEGEDSDERKQREMREDVQITREADAY
ncbi:hypothetical protein TNCV_978661 [Trichonephila clavipes]|nr:hypothetical protein TNCV_978661 [Trichonephila clavipes]